MQFRGEETEGGDRGKSHAVFHSDQLTLALHFEIDGRVDFLNVQLFVNRFGANIVTRANARGDFVPGGLSDDDANSLFAAALDTGREFDGRSFAAHESERIVGQRDFLDGRAQVREHGNLRDQIAADGNLTRRIFRERNADRVAEAVHQQRADADGALDTAIFTLAGFR